MVAVNESPTVVYTDGACSGNPGPGGWAWAVPEGPWASGAESATTNQRMELTAAVEAVATLPRPLVVVSDSTYVVNCFRQSWWKGWLAKQWRNSQGKPVANRDLWEPLIEAHRQDGIEWQWVKGHSGDRWNDVVDALSVAASRDQRGARGVRPGDAVSFDDEVPAPWRVVVHGPGPELAADSAVWHSVRTRMADLLEELRSSHPGLVVVSGLRRGVEELGADIAVELGLPLWVVLPFPDAESSWPDADRRRFAEQMALATHVELLRADAPATSAGDTADLRRRDEWLADDADAAVVVWDGAPGRLARAVDALNDRIPDEVWVLDPVNRR